MKRTLSAILALLTVGSMLVSCSSGDSTDDVTTTAGNDTTEAVETTTSDPNADDLPELDFDGKELNFHISGVGLTKFFKGPEEETGDIVSDTVLERNRAVEERLNIKLNMTVNDNGTSYTDQNPTVTNLVMSGDTTYDLFSYQQYTIAKLATSDYFVNANTLDYVDFDKPYWNRSFMDEMTLNPDKRLFIMGDYFIDSLLQLRVTFYNKTMYGDRYGDPDGLYSIVLDGDWTLDEMTKILNESYEDLNTDGATDKDDRLGMVSWGLSGTADPFVYGTDIKFTKRNSDGSVDVTMMNDDAVILAEKLNTMLNNQSNLVVDSSDEQLAIFKSGNTQFMGLGRFMNADDLRDMESDFGFLPHPKLDEEQDEYYSLIHDTVAVGAIPITSTNIDIIGAVLEALNAETARTLTPTWYETALKVKYTRDDISSQMIDLIHDSATTNFLYAYNYALNGLGLIYRDLIKNKSTDFASTYAKIEPAALEALGELTEYFNK